MSALVAHLGHAFTDPEQRVVDLVRIFGVVAGIVMIGLFFKVARQVRNTRQYGMYACCLFAISAIGTQIENLGMPATYKLIPNTAGVVLGIVFLVKNSQPLHGRSPDRADPPQPKAGQ